MRPIDFSPKLFLQFPQGLFSLTQSVWSAGLNGGTLPINPPNGVLALADAYRAYMDAHEPLRPLQRGQLLDGMYRRPCKRRCSCFLDLSALAIWLTEGSLPVDWADVADKRYDQAFNSTLLALSNELIAAGKASKIPTTDQQHVNGRLALSANHSYSALTLADAMRALERLKDKPFTITASFEAPHPPFIVPYPFYNMCKTAMLSNATRIGCVHDCALRLANLKHHHCRPAQREHSRFPERHSRSGDGGGPDDGVAVPPPAFPIGRRGSGPAAGIQLL